MGALMLSAVLEQRVSVGGVAAGEPAALRDADPGAAGLGYVERLVAGGYATRQDVKRLLVHRRAPDGTEAGAVGDDDDELRDLPLLEDMPPLPKQAATPEEAAPPAGVVAGVDAAEGRAFARALKAAFEGRVKPPRSGRMPEETYEGRVFKEKLKCGVMFVVVRTIRAMVEPQRRLSNLRSSETVVATRTVRGSGVAATPRPRRGFRARGRPLFVGARL